MRSPRDIALSASALDCYRRCPRRFKQRYLDGIPLPETDLPDDTIKRGQIFHNLVQWDALGYPVDGMLTASGDLQLQQYWDDYQTQALTFHPQSRIEFERSVTVSIDGQRLVARFDQLVHEPGGKLTIIDLKIGAPHPGILKREQTRLYPLIAWYYFKDRPHGPERPEDTRLIYWFAKRPMDPMIIPYSSEQLAIDREWLADKVDQVASDPTFPLTSDRTLCAHCGYAAHCGIEVDRSTAAPDEWEIDETLDILALPRIWHDS